MNWLKLETLEQLQDIKRSSSDKRVLIFKHSTRCSISQMALSRLERDWRPENMADIKPYFLDLIRHRDLSNLVAQEFEVEHESPQVLLIENGRAIYDRSHADIRFSELASIAKPKTSTN
jgi:bacillithiol system protein YtxJ